MLPEIVRAAVGPGCVVESSCPVHGSLFTSAHLKMGLNRPSISQRSWGAAEVRGVMGDPTFSWPFSARRAQPALQLSNLSAWDRGQVRISSSPDPLGVGCLEAVPTEVASGVKCAPLGPAVFSHEANSEQPPVLCWWPAS